MLSMGQNKENEESEEHGMEVSARNRERRELVVCISSFTWDKAIPEALIHRSFNNEMQYLICGNLMVCEASLLWYPCFFVLAHRRSRE